MRKNRIIGAKYLPTFFGEWQKGIPYAPLTMVTFRGDSYISKKEVPVGIDISNNGYWERTGQYNTQLENYIRQVRRLSDDLNNAKEEIEKMNNRVDKLFQVNVIDFGSNTGGIDNKYAFTLMCDYVNSNPKITEVYFPSGEYVYSGGLKFTREITLKGNAKLNYIGNDKAIEFGKDTGLNASNYQKKFIVDGITFTGGLYMKQGLFFNNFVTMPRLLNVTFENFGNENAYGMWFDGNNWDTFINNFTWYSNTSYKQNLMHVNSRNINSTRIRFTDSVLSNQNTSPNAKGKGIHLDGFNCEVSNCKIEGFNPLIELGKWASNSIFSNLYFELGNYPNYNTCFLVGEDGYFLSNLTFENIVANLHYSDMKANGTFIKPKFSTVGFQNFILNNIKVYGLNPNVPLISQNDIPSQINNKMYNIYCPNGILHSVGSKIQWLIQEGNTINNGIQLGKTSVNVNNGTIFIDSEGILKFKDYNGIIKPIALN